MAKKKKAVSRRAVVYRRASRRGIRMRDVLPAQRRFAGPSQSDRLLGLAEGVIEEDLGLLRRLAEK